MAQVFGEAGRYVSDQARRKRLHMFFCGLGTLLLPAMVAGFCLANIFRYWMPSLVLTFAALALSLGVLLPIYKFLERKFDALDLERQKEERGLTGESLVARVLAGFPDDFHVINDLKASFGNIDHVVVGPTGVFMLDAKNWRGVVAADGKGELTLNGRPMSKPEVRRFVGRIMTLREKLKVLSPHVEPYLKAVFVFTSAHVTVKPGRTGELHCLKEGELFKYIVENKKGPGLRRDQVEQVAKAFRALACMERDFIERALAPATSPANEAINPPHKILACHP